MPDISMYIVSDSAKSVQSVPQGIGNSAAEGAASVAQSTLDLTNNAAMVSALGGNASFVPALDFPSASNILISDNTFASSVNNLPDSSSIPTGFSSVSSDLLLEPDSIVKLPPKDSNPYSLISARFIPIMIETEFKFNIKSKKIYILFDSTPESIQFTRSANYNQQQFPGRPEPVQVYSNTSAPTFSLVGKFFASSQQEHAGKLQISENLMSLVVPSKHNWVPTPVIVTIGEWKKLRCIVNQVTMKYMGPWSLKGQGLPLHAPRYFEADMSFTIVSEANKVSYIEDLVENKAENDRFSSEKEVVSDYIARLDAQFLQFKANNSNNGMSSFLITDFITKYLK